MHSQKVQSPSRVPEEGRGEHVRERLLVALAPAIAKLDRRLLTDLACVAQHGLCPYRVDAKGNLAGGNKGHVRCSLRCTRMVWLFSLDKLSCRYGRYMSWSRIVCA